MKIAILILVVILVALAWLFVRRRPTSTAESALTLEQKLEILADGGFKLAEPFTTDNLLASFGRADYESPGFDLALVGLGITEEEEPWRNHCVNLWHVDTECIEDHGDYARIAKRLAEMAQGSLPLENIQDHVDIENREAWVSFTLRGKDIRFDCEVNDDWLDTDILGRFDKLLRQCDPNKMFATHDLGGQDLILACVTKDAFERLNRRGVTFSRFH